MTPFELLEKANTALYENRPFVLYRKPQRSSFRQEHLHAIFQQNEDLYELKNYDDAGFIFAPFAFPSQNAVFLPEEKSMRITTELPDFTRNGTNGLQLDPDEDLHRQHLKLVENGLKAIEQTALEKVVLSRKQPILQPTQDPVKNFQKALTLHTDAMVYLFHHPQTGTWFGATPESLLTVNRGRFKTMALAGTKPVREDRAPQWAQKEIDEQNYVTRDITEKVGPFLKDMSISKPQNQRAGTLWHLKTDISGKLIDDSSLKKILKNLHPTPAVCGTPRDQAKKFIQQNEHYQREYYTGFLGELNLTHKNYRSTRRKNQENRAFASIHKQTDLYVNLRCLKFSDNSTHLFLGGGVTAQSTPENEWQETLQKAQTMLKVL